MRNRKILYWVGIIAFLFLTSCKKTKQADKNIDNDGQNPIVSKIVANTGIPGDIVHIKGLHFGDKKEAINVLFGQQQAEIITVSTTELSVVVPNLSGQVVVQIDVSGRKSNLLYFQYKQVVIEVDPAQGDKDQLKALLATNDPIVWVFAGNSITQGAKHTHGSKPYSEIFSERVRFEMNRSSDYVINMAISGNTLLQILNDFEHRVAQFDPKVVFCMIGTNDAAATNQTSITQFGDRLETFITKVRAKGAVPVLLTPTPIRADLAPERATLSSYVTKMRDVAKARQVILVDNWKAWEQLNQKYSGGIYRELLNDPLHPNGQGHKEIAMSLFRELSIFDSSKPTCGAPYYEGEH